MPTPQEEEWLSRHQWKAGPSSHAHTVHLEKPSSFYEQVVWLLLFNLHLRVAFMETFVCRGGHMKRHKASPTMRMAGPNTHKDHRNKPLQARYLAEFSSASLRHCMLIQIIRTLSTSPCMTLPFKTPLLPTPNSKGFLAP